MRNLLPNIRPLLLSLLGTLLMAFVTLQPALGQQSARQLLDLNELKFLQTEVRFSAGRFNLSTHSKAEADLQFLYSREDWKPEVTLEQSGSNRLIIWQPEGKNFNMNDDERNEWDIKLPRKMVGELRIRMGAGEGNIDLGGARLERLEVEAGAGDFNMNLANTAISELKVNVGVGSLKLDLTGPRTNNLIARINGGIGDLKLQLPSDIGVRIKVTGLGGVDNFGLSKEDGYYVNEAWGKSTYSIDVIVIGGLGNVEMALENGVY